MHKIKINLVETTREISNTKVYSSFILSYPIRRTKNKVLPTNVGTFIQWNITNNIKDHFINKLTRENLENIM